MKSLRTKELADRLGVTTQTIRKYVKQNKIPYHETPGGQLVFTPEDVEEILGSDNSSAKTYAFYVRSSSGDKNLLHSQQELLEAHYPAPVKVFSDKGSGLNESRPGLQKLLDMVIAGEITDVAVTQKDRISRFGVGYLEKLFSAHGVTLHILEDTDSKTPEQELMDDFMALIASFTGRFYRLRSWENQRKLLDKAKDSMSE